MKVDLGGDVVSALTWLLEHPIKHAFNTLQTIFTILLTVQLGAILFSHGAVSASCFFVFDCIYKFLTPDYETALIKGYLRPIIGLHLCRKCRILRYWPKKYKKQHYDDIIQLAESGSKGCWLCCSIHEQLLQSQVDRDDPPVFDWPDDLPRHRLLLWFAERTETSSGYLDQLRGKSYIAYIYGRHPRQVFHDSSSEGSFNLVKEWVGRCDTYHSCYQGGHTPLPTRVIDVNGEEPYLFISDGYHAPYTTLSHCWGGEQPLITSTSTLEERRTRIPMESLPQLYRDAVTVTRRLGIRFLWIDSLCILQDSKEDWSREAAKMGDVYRLSYLTLYALSSPNCHHGMLVQRHGLLSGGTSSPNPSNGLERTRDDVFRTAPLCQRAWALQERLLSPRLLYYSDGEMFWECLACTAREGNYRVVPYKSAPYRYESYQCPQVRIPLVRPLDETPSFPVSLPSDWQIIVSEYTRCRLTYRSDKLPALSGLAYMFQRNTGYTYAAGLWKENLADELLWFCPVDQDDQHQDTRASIGPCLEPSWSWISTDLSVRFKALEDVTRSRAWDFDLIQLIASHPATGDIKSSTLTIRADFYRISLQSQPGTRNCTAYNSSGRERFGKGVLDATDEDPGVLKQCAAVVIKRKTQKVLRSQMFQMTLDMTYLLIVVPASKNATGEEVWRRIGLAWTTQDIPYAPERSLVRLV